MGERGRAYLRAKLRVKWSVREIDPPNKSDRKTHDDSRCRQDAWEVSKVAILAGAGLQDHQPRALPSLGSHPWRGYVWRDTFDQPRFSEQE